MQSDDELDSKLDALADAISSENKAAIVEWIQGESFIIVSLGSEDGAAEAMVLETEDFSALVAFMDEDLAEQFVESISDQIEVDAIELIEVEGEDLLTALGEELGLLINPDSEDGVSIEPRILHGK